MREHNAKAIRWGVMGCGGIADRRTIPEGILPSEDSALVAVESRGEGTAKRIAQKYGVRKYYVGEEDLLKDEEVDAVYIATPPYLHLRQVIAAAESGKHVLCEKPLALTVRECEDIVDACKRNDVVLQVGFMMRFHSCHKEALRLIKQGSIGQPVMGRAQLTCWYPELPGAWRQDPVQGGGGSLMDMGIHCIDLLRMFLGEVQEVFALIDNLTFHYPVEDASLVTLRFDGNACGFVDNFFNIPDASAQNRLEIYGTKGCIMSDGTIGQESTGKLEALIQGGDRAYDAKQSRESLGMKPLELNPATINIYRAEIEHFINCIQGDLEPINSGLEATKDQKIVLAAYESSRTGRKIRINHT